MGIPVPRVVFVGGTESGQRLLECLVGLGVNVVGIVSWHPCLAGTVSGYANFDAIARQLDIPNIPVAESINHSAVVEAIAALKPDILFVLAWGQLLKAPLLTLPPLGVVGRHNALLPQRRGRAPGTRRSRWISRAAAGAPATLGSSPSCGPSPAPGRPRSSTTTRRRSSSPSMPSPAEGR